MEAEKLKKILDDHRAWWLGNGGARADLQGADLRGAYLQRAYLQGADLRGAYLQRAYLQRAYLQGADLRGAYLRGAYLQRADLQGADLRGAYLQRADLQGADLQGADLRGAKYGGKPVLAILGVAGIGSEHRHTVCVVLPDTEAVQCGCFRGTLDGMAVKVEQTHAANPRYLAEYRAAVGFLRACCVEARKAALDEQEVPHV